MQPYPDDAESLSSGERRETPQHGFRGEPVAAASGRLPASLTVAVSREAGARGGTIARRAAAKLGWQVYNQELLEYMAQEGASSPEVVQGLPNARGQWAEVQLQRLLREQVVSRHPSVIGLARVVLALGAQGEVVLVGRGAGRILPPESCLNVRIVAPLDERIAYMSEWLRLTLEEAAEQVRLRDERRAEFLNTHFHREPADVYQYDLVLNSKLLGEDNCAELIAQAARAKLASLVATPP